MYLQESQRKMGDLKSQLLRDVFILHADIIVEWLTEAETLQQSEFNQVNPMAEDLKLDILRIQTGVECLSELKTFINKIKDTHYAE